MSSRPSPAKLWLQAGGGTPTYSRDRYRELLREHGHLVPLAPGEAAESLPCGWPHLGTRPAVCVDCGHRHAGLPCADHTWRDSCPYEAGADCSGGSDA